MTNLDKIICAGIWSFAVAFVLTVLSREASMYSQCKSVGGIVIISAHLFPVCVDNAPQRLRELEEGNE